MHKLKEMIEAPEKPARRRSRSKQMVIVEAAWRLFMEHGFGRTSMDAVAQAAGVSKTTLYAYFKDKEQLFAEAVTREGEQHSAALDQLSAPAALAPTLHRAGQDFARLMLSDGNVTVYRIIMSEAATFPNLGNQFYHAGPDRLITRLAARIEQAMQDGDLMRHPPRLLAGQFIGLILGELQLRALLGVTKRMGTRERQTIVRLGVEAFLRAYGRSL